MRGFDTPKGVDKPEFGIFWYVTHHGQAYGPVAFEDLRYEADRGKLRPKVDYIWREGFKTWIFAGEVDGLFDEKKEETEDDGTIDELVDEYFERKEWGGMGRAVFFVLAFIIPVLVAGAWFYFRELEPLYLIGAGVVAAALVVFSMMKRLKNLAMSHWWILGAVVPLVNAWLFYRLFACPKGYREHKEMDDAGWLLSWVYWFPVAALMGLGIFAMVKGPDAFWRLLDHTILPQLSF